MLADGHGGVLTLGERECSIQRRHQKLIEESPSPALTPETREEMEAAAERACRRDRVHERGHARVPARLGRRLLLHRAERPAPGRAPRHRARHRHRHRPRAAADRGRRAARRGPAARRAPGHAIEIRINAEDPANGFAPSPGRIERLRVPGGPGVRLDTHVEAGSTIPPTYDSLIAKLIVWDADRPAAIARGLRALGELEVEGIATTRDFAARRPPERGVRERRVQTRRTSTSTPHDALPAGSTAHGALPPLPVGPHRAAARDELRGRDRRVRARAGRGRRRARATSSTRGSPRSPATGRRTSSARSSGTSSGSASTSSRKVRSRSRWRSTRRSPWRSGTRPRTRGGS